MTAADVGATLGANSSLKATLGTSPSNAADAKGVEIADAQKVVRGDKLPTVEEANPQFFSKAARSLGFETGELITKQAGNRVRKRGSQGKAVPPTRDAMPSAALPLPPSAPLGRRGRQTIFTPELTLQMLQLLSLGMSRCQAAGHLGIDRSSISRALSRDLDLKAEVERAEIIGDMQPEMTVIAEAQKNWKAAAWLLEFKAKHHPRGTGEDGDEERTGEKPVRKRKAR